MQHILKIPSCIINDQMINHFTLPEKNGILINDLPKIVRGLSPQYELLHDTCRTTYVTLVYDNLLTLVQNQVFFSGVITTANLPNNIL